METLSRQGNLVRLRERPVSRPKVVYWNTIPSPYVVGRFNAVSQLDSIEFEAWFTRRGRASWTVCEDEWQFKARYLPHFARMGYRVATPVPLLMESRPDLIVSLYSDPSCVLGSLAAMARSPRVAFRIVPTYDAWQPRSLTKEIAKHVLLRGVDAAKVPGVDGMRQALRYGLEQQRMFVVTQSVDTEHYARARSLENDERERLKRALGLNKFVFLYVGRIWKPKGIEYLLESFENVQMQFPDTSLLLLGDGRDMAEMSAHARAIGNVIMPGFIQRDEIVKFYGLSDAFVFPTLGDPNGVVVEEAMCAGLPVVSSDAAGDIHNRVIDGRSGFVVPAGDSVALAERMRWLVQDPVLARAMGQAGASLAAAKSHERYAQDFERFVFSTLSLPRRRTIFALGCRVLGRGVEAVFSRNSVSTPFPQEAPS